MPPESNARCVSAHPEDLADGRVVAPGERFHLSAEQQGAPQNERLIDEGKILITQKDEKKLTGKALDKRADELNIEGRSDMNADQLRTAVAEAEAEQERSGS